MSDDVQLTAKEFQQQDGVEDWRMLAVGASAWFGAPSQAAGAALVRRIAELAGRTSGPLDIDLRARGVHVRIGTNGFAGLTRGDAAVARAISAAAHDLGLAPDPSRLQAVQLAMDALDKPAVMPFWQAVLGYELFEEDDLVDPMRRDPPIWFQQQDQPRPLRNRLHLDVARPRALAAAAAETVGGGRTGVYGLTLSDAEGNELDFLPDDPLGEEPGTADWRVLFGGMTFYPIAEPQRAAELAAAVASVADDAGLPLLVDLRPDGVTIDTGKDQWEDERFVDLARRVQSAARALDLATDNSRLRFVQIGIDAVDVPVVREFWRSLLGYEYDPRAGVTDIFDPRRLAPPIFFQQMSADEEARRKQRNRIHIDVFVPDDQVRARIDSALAAGGRLVHDGAPEGWTIADPEGNEVDIAVSVGREENWAAEKAAGRT